MREAADRDRARRGNARRLIVRLAAAGLVAGAFGGSVAPGLAQDTTSTSSTASDPAPTTPASTLGTTTPTTGTTQTTAGPGTYTVDPGPTMTVPPAPPPKRKPKSTSPAKPPTRCVPGTTRTTRKRLAIRSAQENPVGQPRPRTPAPTPRCKPVTHPKPKVTPQKAKTNANGTPSPSNPTFSLAQPGAAQVGVPNFFIEKFRIPPFLLPIYQAAGTEYGVPWQVLAAINEIETDYGRNLSVSSAGALGWMQFMPSSWATYGVDANGDGTKDPYNPVDAIFAAGRYLRAAGADKDINKAIFAYNHADWYVQSVMLRAKLIGGMPADLVGSLTGLTEGHFPVAARATYAQSLDPRAASKPRNGNAAVNVAGDAHRRSVDIFSRAGAPAVAVNDGVIRRVGTSKKLGRYVVLEDVYGNTYTYAHLGRVAGSYPAPKPVQPTTSKLRTDLETPPRDPSPGSAASAGRQQRATPPRRQATTSAAPVAAAPAKERLFAYPSRNNAYRAGGDQQLLGTGTPVAGYATYDDYISKVLGLRRSEVVFKALKPGARVIAGTIIGRVDKTDAQLAPHVTFSIKPAGRGAPQIDPKPILDGWKLLEATAIYRASGKNPFWGRDAKNPSI
ncbi:MAG TPA: lytic murein transglycosylase, partial [Solirubrobacteraceae bacterium]|nr:lytic murein transglycosylase [Solirubrobacteraceae bacterium]